MMVMMLVLMVVMAAAALAFLMMVMMLVLMVVMAAGAVLIVVMMVLMFLLQLCQLSGQSSLTFQGMNQLLTGKIRPGSGDDGGSGVVLSQHSHSGVQLGLGNGVGPGQDDGGSGLDLVVVELTEVLAVDLHLTGIGHSHGVTQSHFVGHDLVNGTDNVRQLANTRGLDEDPVGVVLRNHLLQSLAEIAHQGAADATGVHFGDVDAGILQETAVDADLTKLILDQNQFLAGIGFGNHLLNEGGLACAQEATVNINLCHGKHTFP